MVEVDITVVGAGVVGLAVARELSSLPVQLAVLEKESAPGTGVSSRSSEVIHAGIYYPPASLKARLCVEGNVLLREFCSSFGVAFRQTGKVIVAASPDEEQDIERLCRRGLENGVRDLRILSRKELLEHEPNVGGTCALFSPTTAIVDSHRLVRLLEAHCLDKGTPILYRTELVSLEKSSGGFVCTACGPRGECYRFASRIVINACGLDADRTASLAGIDPDGAGYRIHPVKGEYFRVHPRKQGLVRGMVYPIPERNLAGLGIHATKDLAGSLRLGPNAFAVRSLSYDVDPLHALAFFESARSLLPFLEIEDLSPDTAGIRPKLQAPGGPQRDFVIAHESGRGLPGLINLVGIESPGLTSCLAIAQYVSRMIVQEGLAS
ncbi:MAG: NAD(P)/FAD-dependent oxidoreductase [Desulfomonilia bacterium]